MSPETAEKNRMRAREWARKKRAADPAWAREKNRQYRLENPEKAAEYDRRNNQRMRREYRTVEGRAYQLNSRYKQIDKRKGHGFDLTTEFTANLISQPCHYCNTTDTIGLDRIDNTIGHTQNNVVPCCKVCNVARNAHFSYDEMVQFIGPAIRKARLKRAELERKNPEMNEGENSLFACACA